MSKILSLDDYNAPNWGPLVLSEDWQAFRAFWSAVLQLATADQADAVVYRPDLGEDFLKLEIGRQTQALDPPPSEYRRELLTAARRMAAGGPIRYAVQRLWSRWQTYHSVGRVLLATPAGTITWEACDVLAGEGITFLRR